VGRVRQVGQSADWALAAVVLVHLAISLVHGRAHAGALVALSRAAAAFVYIVILAGPLLGLAASHWRPGAGAWIVTVSFAGSLVFGLVNHFVIPGPDRIDQVAAQWRSVFGVTAALLIVSESAGVAIGVRSALRAVRRTA